MLPVYTTSVSATLLVRDASQSWLCSPRIAKRFLRRIVRPETSPCPATTPSQQLDTVSVGDDNMHATLLPVSTCSSTPRHLRTFYVLLR